MLSKYRVDFVLLFSVLFCTGAGIFVLYTQETNPDASFPAWMKQSGFLIVGLIVMLPCEKLTIRSLAVLPCPCMA